jgi:SAM-dependent methyltransferase
MLSNVSRGQNAPVRLGVLRYAGWSVACPLCERRFRRFAGDRWDGRRWGGDAVRCPSCGSLPRHRLLWLLLERSPELMRGSVLHVAPEPTIAERLRATASSYTSVDADPAKAMAAADVSALPFDDASFELVICSHVLEHVTDDGAALRELRRVVRGTLLLQTPVNYDQEQTFEDAEATDPETRLRMFSQEDHVRVFGRDLPERLRAAGFTVETVDAGEFDDAARYVIDVARGPLRNDVFVCKRDE